RERLESWAPSMDASEAARQRSGPPASARGAPGRPRGRSGRTRADACYLRRVGRAQSTENAGETAGQALSPLVDTHCHLAWDSYEDDLEAVLAGARAAGVEQMVVVATDPDTAEASAAVCRGREGLFPTTGMHPNDLPEAWKESFARVEAHARTGAYV